MKVTINITGRPEMYIKHIIEKQGVTLDRILTDALSLYIEAYDHKDKELAFVEGDIAIRKLNTLSMWGKHN